MSQIVPGSCLGCMVLKEETSSLWHYRAQGSGPTLVLLHGIGMSHAAWNPVMPYLASMRRVITFDIAGLDRRLPCVG